METSFIWNAYTVTLWFGKLCFWQFYLSDSFSKYQVSLKKKQNNRWKGLYSPLMRIRAVSALLQIQLVIAAESLRCRKQCLKQRSGGYWLLTFINASLKNDLTAAYSKICFPLCPVISFQTPALIHIKLKWTDESVTHLGFQMGYISHPPQAMTAMQTNYRFTSDDNTPAQMPTAPQPIPLHAAVLPSR